MKICAHFTVAPFEHYHVRLDSVGQAKRELRSQGRFDSFPCGERPSVWVAEQCNDCSDVENYHEHATIYELGPRGGVRKAGYYP